MTKTTFDDIVYENDIMIPAESIEKIIRLLGKNKFAEVIIDGYNNIPTDLAEGTEIEQSIFLEMVEEMQDILSKALLLIKKEKND